MATTPENFVKIGPVDSEIMKGKVDH